MRAAQEPGRLWRFSFLPLLPYGVCNQASGPIFANWLNPGRLNRLSQGVLYHGDGLVACIRCIKKARLLKFRRQNYVPISIDGAADLFGSGNLHIFRNVVEHVPGNEKEKRENQAAKNIPLERPAIKRPQEVPLHVA